MVISATMIIIAVVIILIWFIFEFRRTKHKIFAIFLIALVLFTYFTFTMVMKKNNVDLKTPENLMKATKLYVTWLGSAFSNVKTITSNTIKMDWTSTNTHSNSSSVKVTSQK